jgi:tetratricopeptide (TPR) repeat protein
MSPSTRATGGALPASNLVASASSEEPPPRPLRRCFSNLPAWEDPSVSELLDRAGDLFDAEDFAGALACSEEAARQAPRSVEAHHDRAAALLHLGRADEARDALLLALSLNPEDGETLEAAADLFINQLPPSADRSSIGLEYARRGYRRVLRRDRARAARLGLLEAQALIDLGRADEALRRLGTTISLAPRLAAARYEKGVALFELCRFREAREVFEKVLTLTPDHAHALYHLGLIDERERNPSSASARFVAAAEADPAAFPLPPEVSRDDFAGRVRKIVAGLPSDVQADLAKAHLETSELPAIEDLVAEKPPLSPTILGLFRGLPLDWSGDADRRPQAGRGAKGRAPAPRIADGASEAGASDPGTGPGRCSTSTEIPERTIILYRRNLLRSLRNPGELDDAIQKTLLHEVGHLRGEDDGSLRDRGLE